MSYTQFETTPSPFYKGKGEHSVNSLEKLCEDFKELLYQKQIRLQEMEEKLEDKMTDLIIYKSAVESAIEYSKSGANGYGRMRKVLLDAVRTAEEEA